MRNKNILKFFVATAIAWAFVACADDVDVKKTDGSNGTPANITISIRQDWNDDDATRAARAAQSGSNQSDVITAERSNGNQPVYIWCEELDGIQTHNQTIVADKSEGTRGVLMTNNNGFNANADKTNFHADFSIWGNKATDNTKATRTGTDNQWSLSPDLTWDDDNTYTFYGVAPYATAETGYYSSQSKTGFTYSTPATATQQPDMMVGTATGKRSNSELKFQFEHVMAAIKFKIGKKGFESGLRIAKIELFQIYTQNTYTFGSGWASLNESSTTGSVSQTFDFSTTDKFNTYITSDTEGTTFLVLPQTLPDNAAIVVTIEDDYQNIVDVIGASINGREWVAGHTYTYVISSYYYPNNDYLFYVEDSPTFDYQGNAVAGSPNTFGVISYKTTKEGVTTEVGWDVTGYKQQNEDGSWPDAWETTMPAMLKSLNKTSGSGGYQTAETVQPTVNGQTPIVNKNERRQNELRDTDRGTKGTSANPLDLSRFQVDNETQVERTTANCYIVRYGGWYQIPLVIGNTIKEGNKWTPDWYVPTSSGSLALSGSNGSTTYYYGYKTFVDYLGNQVSRTNFKLDGAVTPTIVWHDFADVSTSQPLTVIKDLSITSGIDGLKFLNFSVDKDNIQQGNAVIAVKDSDGKIMWSWHIYVTDLDWTKDQVTLTNYEGVKNVMPIENLGYVEKERTCSTYVARKMKILLTQKVSGDTLSVVLTQNSHEKIAFDFWDTKYQWGRKDPMPGIDTGTSYYSPTSGYQYINFDAPIVYSTATQNPHLRYRGGYNIPYANSWSAKITNVFVKTGDMRSQADKSVVKTIYDPCPPGFRIPYGSAFTGLIKTSGSSAAEGSGNINGEAYKAYSKTGTLIIRGWTFNADNGRTVFFPLSGRGADAGPAADMDKKGWLWTCSPYSDQGYPKAFNPSFTDTQVNVHATNNLQMSQSVRPVKETETSTYEIISINHDVTVDDYSNGGTGNLDLQ